MKTFCCNLVIGIVLVWGGSRGFGQGKISVVNDGNHLVYFATSVRAADAAYMNQPVPASALPSGVTLVVDLYGGPTAGNLTLQTTVAISSVSAGIFGPRNFISPNLPGGQTATMQIKVRESSFATAELAQAGGGYWGYSQIFTMNPSATIAYNSIVNPGGSTLSTWSNGVFSLGASGFGAIEVGLGFEPGYPTIYIPPASGSYVVGTNVNLSVAAVGATPLGFQWRKDGLALTGATNVTLNLTNVTLDDAGYYDIVLTNYFGSATSTKAVLQVLPPHAPSIRVNNGLAVGTVTVTTSATISIGGGFSGGLIFYTLDGSNPTTSSSLYNSPVTLTNSQTVRAMSLSADFSQSSEAPAISVLVLPVYALATSVSGSGTVLLNPAGGVYASNSVVSVTAQASANWAFNHWGGDLAGTSNPTNLTLNGARSIQAVFVPTAYPLTLATPGGGSVTANGQVIAANTYYPTGSIVALQATPVGGWSFMRWQGTTNSTANPLSLAMSQTQNVQAVFGTMVSSNISGAGGIVMSVANPVPFGTVLTNTAVPAPGYYFVAWSGAVSGTNNPATFAVTSATPTVGALFAPVVFQPFVTAPPTNQIVVSGAAANFTVSAGGTAPLSYQWYSSVGPIPTATNSTLTIAPALTNNTGNYFAVVSNPYGQATSTVATLTVFIPASIAGGPFSQLVAAHDTATFTVSAAGYPPLSYQWLFNGLDIPGANSSSLVITNVGTNHLGNYWVEAWNAYSAVTSSPAALLLSPSLQTPFSGVVAIWGTEATLSVSAWGSGTLGYQWYKDGVSVPGATNSSLVFPAVQFGDGGLYSVVVSSPYGSITNTPAQLVINPANISLGLCAMIMIEGVAGYTYDIEYTTDLQNTNSWQNLTNLTLTQPIHIWTDTSVNVLTNQKRFYRVTSH